MALSATRWEMVFRHLRNAMIDLHRAEGATLSALDSAVPGHVVAQISEVKRYLDRVVLVIGSPDDRPRASNR